MVRNAVPKPDFSAVRGKRLLIALSGGADSVALAALLCAAREADRLTLFAAHVDHGIRPESAEDAAFCRALCQRLDIPFFCERVDIPALARLSRRGFEAEARLQRYAILNRFMAETGADYIALAHHMDDQAETVLMHLSRGAGVEGVCGMRAIQPQSRLYRPLLDYRKAELVEYLKQNGFDWRDDSTNRVDDNPRNAIRLNVIPELEHSYPQFVRAAARFAKTAQIESDYLEALTGDFLSKHFADHWLDLSELPPRAILRRALRAACPVNELPWDQLNALEALCFEPHGKIDLSADIYAERAGHRLYFVPKRIVTVEPVQLKLDGETVCEPLCTITATPCEPKPIKDDPWRQVLNREVLEGAVIRTRREGDRIRPLGSGDKLLSDYFIDKKIDRPLRDSIALIAVGNRVHWVTGYGISQDAAVHPGDGAVLLEYHDHIQRRKASCTMTSKAFC